MACTLKAVSDAFRSSFVGAPLAIASAPGRINLIGEHTDYQGGYVFPFALQHRTWVAVGPSETPVSKLISHGRGEFKWDGNEPPVGSWMRYVWAICEVAKERFRTPIPPINLLVNSDLPIGAGLSSSAAIEAATLLALMAMIDEKTDPLEVAHLCHLAETRYVGVPCGLMDQIAVCCAEDGKALFLPTSDPAEMSQHMLPPEIAWIVCNTNVKHSLEASAYPLRVQQSKEAAASLGVNQLVSISSLESAIDLEHPIGRRARHIITENARALEFKRVLETNDDLSRIGMLLNQSHTSLRDDYEVSCEELDDMARIAQSHPSCFGARMMGGGFGGSVLAAVEHEAVRDFVHHTQQEYDTHHLVKCGLFQAVPSGPAKLEMVAS